MDTEQKLALIEWAQKRHPNCSVRISADSFTGGRVECRTIKFRKEGKKYIQPGWFFVGYADDLLRKLEGETA